MSAARCRGAPGPVRRVAEKKREGWREWADGVAAVAVAAPATRAAGVGVGVWRRVERRRREGRRREKAMGGVELGRGGIWKGRREWGKGKACVRGALALASGLLVGR
jgi:hypothetical protein